MRIRQVMSVFFILWISVSGLSGTNQETARRSDDALYQQIALYIRTGQYDKALEMLESQSFHVSEGEAAIHDLYVDARLLRGLKNFRRENFAAVLSDFREALEFPENLEVEAPLHPRRSAQVYCMIAHVHEELGEVDQARDFYTKAAEAIQDDGVSDITYYRGAALKGLGRDEEAAKVFKSLISAGESELGAGSGMDFSAKFGEKEFRDARIAQARYVRGLGYLGLGDLGKAKEDLVEAVSLDPNHVWARVGLDALE